MDRLDPGRTRNLWSPDADCVFRILPKFVGALGVPMAEWKPGVVANPGVEKGGWPNSGSNFEVIRWKLGRNIVDRLASGPLHIGNEVPLLWGAAVPGSAFAGAARRKSHGLESTHGAGFGVRSRCVCFRERCLAARGFARQAGSGRRAVHGPTAGQTVGLSGGKWDETSIGGSPAGRWTWARGFPSCPATQRPVRPARMERAETTAT